MISLIVLTFTVSRDYGVPQLSFPGLSCGYYTTACSKLHWDGSQVIENAEVELWQQAGRQHGRSAASGSARVEPSDEPWSLASLASISVDILPSTSFSSWLPMFT